MSDMDPAQDGMEHAAHAAHGGEHGGGKTDRFAMGVGVLIAALAAALALTETNYKAVTNSFMADNIAVSDNWAFFQSRNIRATSYLNAAEILDSLPSAGDETRKRAEKMRAEAARMIDDPQSGNGRKQLAARAESLIARRDHSEHVSGLYETAGGILQIAIVLASVSIITRMKRLTLAAGLLGGGAAGLSLLVFLGVL